MKCQRCGGKGTIKGFADHDAPGLNHDMRPSPRVIDRPCPVCSTRPIKTNVKDVEEIARAFPERNPIPLTMRRRNYKRPEIKTLDNIEVLEQLYAELCDQATELHALAVRVDSNRKGVWLMLQETRKKYGKDRSNEDQPKTQN